VECALGHSGYRFELVRVQLEAGFERIAESLLASGFVEARNLDDVYATLGRAVRSARTVAELVSAYRLTVSELDAALADPDAARSERSTRRAVEFIHEHLSEPLSLGQVARVAGFAQDYFSRLFKKSEGVTFNHYVQHLRLERAKQLLVTTALSVEQVHRLSGLSNRAYFQRLFKQSVGKTPLEYRAEMRG
jgi:YesN/AraC family two-component response regulator